MTVTFRAANQAGASAATLTLSVPTGTLDGELMIMQLESSALGDAPLVDLQGWKEIPHATAVASATSQMQLYYKYANSEPASYTFTATNSATRSGGIATFYASGGGSLALDAIAVRVNATGNRVWDGITMAAAGILACFGVVSSASTTPDAAMTERYDGSGTPRAYLMTEAVSSGATGTRTGTGTSTVSLCITVGIIEGNPKEYTGARFVNLTFVAPASVVGTQTINKPALVIDGDLLILRISSGTTDFTPTLPSGWTAVPNGSNTGGAGTHCIRTYYKIAASEPADYTITWSGTRTSSMTLIAFRGEHGWPLLIDDANNQYNATPAGVHTYPSLTATVLNTKLLLISAVATNSTATTVHPLRKLNGEQNGSPTTAAYTEVIDATGATGTRTSGSNGSSSSKTVSILLKEPEPTPSAPTGLSAVGVTDSRIDLMWTDTSPYARTVSIERSDDGSTGWTEIATVDAGVETYSDTGLNPATTKYYRVRALVVTLYSSYSSVDSATTTAIFEAPADVTATALGPRRIRLAWSDESSTESGYEIWRSFFADDGFIQIASVGANVEQYVDTGLETETTYFYKVRAVKA